jgi:hypothetical protein
MTSAALLEARADPVVVLLGKRLQQPPDGAAAAAAAAAGKPRQRLAAPAPARRQLPQRPEHGYDQHLPACQWPDALQPVCSHQKQQVHWGVVTTLQLPAGSGTGWQPSPRPDAPQPVSHQQQQLH